MTLQQNPAQNAVRPGKIRPGHLGRAAVIYVRQSTYAQVRDHTESTARQYGLATEAVRLGWPPQLVEVIDADLGLSGSTTTWVPQITDLLVHEFGL